MLNVFKVEKQNGKYVIYDVTGNETNNLPGKLYSQMKSKVADNGNAIEFTGTTWKQVPMSVYNKAVKAHNREQSKTEKVPSEQLEVMNFINTSYDLNQGKKEMNRLYMTLGVVVIIFGLFITL